MWQPTNTPENDRWESLQRLDERGIPAYPNRVSRTHTTVEAIRAFEALEPGDAEAAEAVEVTVCGRIVRQNSEGQGVLRAHRGRRRARAVVRARRQRGR